MTVYVVMRLKDQDGLIVEKIVKMYEAVSDAISCMDKLKMKRGRFQLDLGQIMAECWDWTKELCAHWNAEVAE